MERSNLWKIVVYASLGTIVLFLAIMYGFENISPVKASQISYAAAAKVGGKCYDCHKTATPGVVEEYAHSKHVSRGVDCLDCHNPNVGNAKVTEHQGFKIVAKPTPKNCGTCHQAAHSQFEASNHAARSWYAVAGAQDFSQEQLSKFHLLDSNGQPKNDGKPNGVGLLVGSDAMQLGCIKCHEIGRVQSDGSIGDCSKCHLGHEFSLAQVRKPETCTQCHLGPDHPQKEVYEESAHGTLYAQSGATWNWDAVPGTLTAKDMPAPTCATCHMSGFGGTPGTHNVSERLAWELTPPIAIKREDWESKRTNMISVCVNCHSKSNIEIQFSKADKLIEVGNQNVLQGQQIISDLTKLGLISKTPFDSAIDFKMFELWHHEGRRLRSGGMMGGPDYVQWHGVFEQKKDLVEMEEMAKELRNKAGEKGIKSGGQNGN